MRQAESEREARGPGRAAEPSHGPPVWDRPGLIRPAKGPFFWPVAVFGSRGGWKNRSGPLHGPENRRIGLFFREQAPRPLAGVPAPLPTGPAGLVYPFKTQKAGDDARRFTPRSPTARPRPAPR